MKTMAGWEEYALVTGDNRLDSYLQPGDEVTQDMVDHFASLVPPALMRDNLIQVGTPYDSQPGSDGLLRPTFGTFSKEAGEWRFCGYCFLGEYVEPKRDSSLIRVEGGSRPEFDYVTSYGQLERVTLEVGAYVGGGLRMAMESFDVDMGERVRFADLTANVEQLPAFVAAVDVETHGEEALEFLEENDFGELTGKTATIDGCALPVFYFDEAKLAKADPRGFERYCQEVGVSHANQEASKDSFESARQQARERAREHNARHNEKKPRSNEPER